MPQQRGEETHQHIKEVAQQLFAKNGYDATGVAEICQAARVSKGAFYHHFASKHDIFMELLQDWLNGLESTLNLVRQETDSVPNALLHMTSMMEGVFQTAEQQLPIFLEFWTQASRNKQALETTIAPYRRYQDFFTRLIQEGIDEGSFWPVDPAVTARIILSLVIGVLLQNLLDPHGADWQAVVQQGLRQLIKGISKQ